MHKATHTMEWIAMDIQTIEMTNTRNTIAMDHQSMEWMIAMTKNQSMEWMIATTIGNHMTRNHMEMTIATNHNIYHLINPILTSQHTHHMEKMTEQTNQKMIVVKVSV